MSGSPSIRWVSEASGRGPTSEINAIIDGSYALGVATGLDPALADRIAWIANEDMRRVREAALEEARRGQVPGAGSEPGVGTGGPAVGHGRRGGEVLDGPVPGSHVGIGSGYVSGRCDPVAVEHAATGAGVVVADDGGEEFRQSLLRMALMRTYGLRRRPRGKTWAELAAEARLGEGQR